MTLILTPSDEMLGVGIILGVGELDGTFKVIELDVTAGGSGYTAVPTVTISDGGGTGATATAVIAQRPDSYVNFSKIDDLTPPESTRDKVAATTHDQVNKKKKFLPGFSGESDVTLDVLYQQAVATTIQAIYDSGDIYGWMITYPEGSNQEFTGFLASKSIASPIMDLMKQKLTICIDDSDPAWTEGD